MVPFDYICNMKDKLQLLKDMITKDRYPMMDGSHKLDHREAIRLIINIRNDIRILEEAILNATPNVYYSCYGTTCPFCDKLTEGAIYEIESIEHEEDCIYKKVVSN